jgi:hypothetical protein
MYVATARKWDGDFQKDRPPSKDRDDRWVNIEKKTQVKLIFWKCSGDRLCYLVVN